MTAEPQDQVSVISGISVADLQTLCVLSGVPPLAGMGVRPLDDLDDDNRIAVMLQSAQSLAQLGYLDIVGPDQFRATSGVSQLILAAGRPSAVMRVVETGDPAGDRLLFVYGIRDLAIVHVIEQDGTQTLFPRSLDEAVIDVEAVLGSHAPDSPEDAAAFTVTRDELMSGQSADPLIHEAAAAAASGVGIRVDLAWISDGEPLELYVGVLGADDQPRWLLTGLGDQAESVVIGHRASAHSVHEAFVSMLEGSVFDIDDELARTDPFQPTA